jgi:hypothetical protein
MDIILWKQLPLDMVDHILRYDDKIVNRNGKYMNRLLPSKTQFLLNYHHFRLQRYQRLCYHIVFVIIPIQTNVLKQITFTASYRGITVMLFSSDVEPHQATTEEQLWYTNIYDYDYDCNWYKCDTGQWINPGDVAMVSY